MALTYPERTGMEGAVGSARMSLDRGASVRKYVVQTTEPGDLFTLGQDILGYTNYDVSSTGALNREPPYCDPVWTMFFAESIDAVRGVGQATQAAGNPFMEVPPIGDYCEYFAYDVDVAFTMRQYSLLQDSDISVVEGSWWPDPLQDGSSSQEFFVWPNEFTRYCEVGGFQPTGEYLNQQGGSLQNTMNFNSSVIGTDKQCAFMPSIQVPNYRVTLLWRQIPLRYVTSPYSFIANHSWTNRVNQNAIQMPWNGPGETCAPGSLLYENFSFVPYTPPTGYQWNNQGNGNASQKLIDLSLYFIWTTRTLPSGETPAVAPSYPNFIVGGHNLAAWNGDLNWHYCNLNTTNKRPLYKSFPCEALQCDPDYLDGQDLS